MLAQVLALVVGLGSFAFFMDAFLFPTLHRKSDFIWSGVGLFYALVLGVCAGDIRGGILLGQLASVALLGWFGWQTLKLRWELIPLEQKNGLLSPEAALGMVREKAGLVKEKLSGLSSSEKRSKLQEQASGTFNRVKSRAQTTAGVPTEQPPQTIAQPSISIPEEEILTTSESSDEETILEPAALESVPEPVQESPQVVTPTSKAAKPSSTITPETLKEVLTSLKEGAQQLWSNLTGRKPKRPTIVIHRPTSATAPTPEAELLVEDLEFEEDDTPTTIEAPEATNTQSDAAVDLDLEEEIELLNNETPAAPEATAELVQPETFTETGEVANTEPVAAVEGVVIDTIDLNELEASPIGEVTEPVAELQDLDELDPPAAIAADLESSSSTAPKSDNAPSLIRPNPPDPKLVEAALQDAEEKHQPASPPEPETDGDSTTEIPEPWE